MSFKLNRFGDLLIVNRIPAGACVLVLSRYFYFVLMQTGVEFR
ncbi:hypothetical protein [Anaerocolumna chitinilytica]|nr:hypothetical protein [Anaerocolumna chitinilytica]